MSGDPDPYRGLCASTYDALVPPDAVGDVSFFRELIRDGGEPALEVGCGTGRLLLQYAAEGLDIEGVDVSEEMLEICRSKAAALDLTISVHRQPMQSLQLDRRYRLIFIPYFSFQLLTDDADITAALNSFQRHLEPGGRLVVPLFFPHERDVGQTPAPEGEWRLRRQTRQGDGTRVECWENAAYDFDAQIKRATLRFNLVAADGTIAASEQRSLGIRWHTQQQFRELLEGSGFTAVGVLSDHSFDPAGPDHPSFAFVARRPADR